MLSRRAAALLLGLALSPGAAWAGVTVGNFRSEGKTGYADVTYTNGSDAIFSSVKIECVPPGAADRRGHINIYLSNHLEGGIQPGYSATRTISFTLPGEDAKPEDVSCEVQELPLVTR